MNTSAEIKRITIPDIQSRKGQGSIVSLTAYTKPMAAFIDPYVDLILIGDSLGMVSYGMNNTLAVTLDMMIAHSQAVMRGSQRACVIVDLPFGSYQESPQIAYRNCVRVMAETGAQGVKLEGGEEMAETVEFLVKRAIPVMAHVGLMPQHTHVMGGFRAQGLNPESQEAIYNDAMAMEKAGAFCVLMEGTGEPLARRITLDLKVPTIGIGASPACDGQILVTEDIVGLFSDYTPKFVKRYIDLGTQLSTAVEAYAKDVRAGTFPELGHCFGVTDKKG